MDKKIIYEELLKLRGGVDCKGFEYIVSGIEKFYHDTNLRTIEVYDAIATEYNDTRSRVERAIRHYVSKCMLVGNKEEINKLNMNIRNTGCPTNTEFLKAFALYLKINN